MHDPCNCRKISPTSITGNNTPCESCIIARSSILLNNETIECNGESGDTIQISLDELNDNSHLTGVTYSIVSHDIGITPYIDIDNNLVISADAGVVPGDSPFFVYYKSEDDSGLKGYGTIEVPIKNKCNGVVCPPGEGCDPCTGVCSEGFGVNMSINII